MLKAVKLLLEGKLFPQYDGLVEVKEQDGFTLLNYSRECQYRGGWDEVTAACRGLIVDTKDGTIAALPFPKFFNLGERPETQLENLPNEPFQIFEKIDGSLGILYRDCSGRPRLATRGSFVSEQAIRGTEMLGRLPGVSEIPAELTFLFEIIYAENRSAIRYGFDGLVLLAVYNRFTGEELPWREVIQWAENLGLKTPKLYAFNSVSEAVERVKTLPADMEGYVIRFAGGFRVKLKGNAFLELHKLVWGMTPNRALEALSEGTFENFLKQLPEELRLEFETLARPFIQEAERLKVLAERYFTESPRGSRKEFAIWVQRNVPAEIRRALFQLLDGQTPNWYKFITPQHPLT